MPAHTLSRPIRGQAALPSLSRRALSALVGLWRTRRALRDLDDRMLRDIGVSRSEALTEARRPIWDVPTGWRR
ncbi:conserved hypothetical protein [Dinoroseobacter shibae DFL 12 = DSM 16493]|jgi:uncharacterized protein YjiS (DUF1127 family)|uniref:YjiS-like domain-containing protein n=1 Tax=Dinoroseobacter shibae (strain DSM 16493 / NCIMB 14021 / DFL 12) TaxID=398580 RepID=A8LJ16_DINSH|nr:MULTISPECIES: DUF1127 domain-containing protein [Dinoroseobacter]ABV94511.1 conserved hypothetical protein [Dinoroseobacter shibae DFL 12 = DSM 16493]MDD9717049.1 DUF1127 domain-containing protein [Dinoroseobacter sp. PD6]URF45938.1 DUF1127 domain-containing protein [Dinoroseobacter shibae]URF50244.1 DUF1127 domain-containing protein [Dinoroseobacter shibae]